MNQKNTYLIISFLVLSIVGAVLGYQESGTNASVTTGTPSEQLLSKKTKTPRSIGKESPPLTTKLFSDLKDAASRADQKELEKISIQWISKCSQKQFKELVELLTEEPDNMKRGLMMEAMVGRWVELDPQAALNYASQHIHPMARWDVFPKIFEALAVVDPAVAFDFLSKKRVADDYVYSSDYLTPSFAKIFQEWKKNDHSAAFAALVNINDQNDLSAALLALTHAGDASERDEIFEKISILKNQKMRNEAWQKAISNWAKEASLYEVTDWIASQPFDKNLVYQLEQEIAIQHAEQDPRAMADWLLKRSDEKSLPDHLETAVKFWATDQPNACGEWLNQINPGSHKDGAIATYAKFIFQHDPLGSFTWAQSVQNDRQRDELLDRIAPEFYRVAPQGFLNAILESDLPENRREELVKQARKIE